MKVNVLLSNPKQNNTSLSLLVGMTVDKVFSGAKNMIGISGLTSAPHHLIELFELHLLQTVIVLQLISAMRMNVVQNLDWLQSL